MIGCEVAVALLWARLWIARWGVTPLTEAPVVAFLGAHALLLLFLIGSLASADDALVTVSGARSPDAVLTAALRPYAAEQYINPGLPPGLVVAVGVSKAYYLDRPYRSDFVGRREHALESRPVRSSEFRHWYTVARDRG